MTQNEIAAQQQYEHFVKQVCEAGRVWGLENEEGFATSNSNEYEDSEGEAVGLICFWSDLVLAKSCAVEDWANYQPVEIALSDFIENWCVGMSNDGLMIGISFDKDMNGFETDPLDLIIDLSKELKNQGKRVELNQYQQLEDLIEEINKLDT